MLRVLDLFSGIGGFSLGLERTGGFRTVAFCEIEPYCRAVLGKHWPGVPCFTDVRVLDGELLDIVGVERPDVICGGFPCQDISLAGKGAGLAGERSGLWREYHRLIAELRPAYAIIENVSALRSRGLDEVLRSLAQIGYDAEWHCIPACAVGAPHRRDRVWIVAHSQCEQLREQSGRSSRADGTSQALSAEHGEDRFVADSDSRGFAQQSQCDGEPSARIDSACRGDTLRRDSDVADTKCQRHTGPRKSVLARNPEANSPWRQAVEPGDGGVGSTWLAEPDVGRVAHGVPARVDRLRSLGNAVVPQIPQIIGEAILAAEGSR